MPNTYFSKNFSAIEESSVTKRYKYKIGNEVLDRIKAEKMRTGTGARGLLHAMHHIYPPELSGDMINNWISGRTKKAYWEHVNWVLERYAILPTKHRKTT